jgi:hypothetical protein
MKHDRMPPFEGVDRQAAPFAFAREPIRRKEAREVVHEACEPGSARIFAMTLRQAVGQARDAHAMRETVILTDLRADLTCERNEVQRLLSI